MSTPQVWTGRILSGLAVAFLLMDAAMKLARARPALEATARLGFPESSLVPLGALLLGCILLYVLPWTSSFGALLLTGYLGGAVAAQVRVHNPLLSHALFPVYVSAFIWGGLALRCPRLLEIVRLGWRSP